MRKLFLPTLFSLVLFFPASSFGQCLVRGCENPPRQEIMQARTQCGLIFFYSPTCGYCTQQLPVLRAFVDRYGWEIVPVDVNSSRGAPFQIGTTPTLYLVWQGKPEPIPVGIGLMELDELEDNILAGIRFFGG